MTHNNDDRQYIGFQLEGQRYAFPIADIREIVILDSITPVPSVAAWVEGVTNLRGDIIPVVNMRMLLGMPPTEFDDETRTIVLRVGNRTVGCTVDQVNEVLRMANENIQPPPESVTTGGVDYIAALARHHESLIIILDAKRLLGDASGDAIFISRESD